MLKRWPTGSPPPSRILQQHPNQGSVLTRCLVPNASIAGGSTNAATVLEGGRTGVVQQQMILPQGQIAQRMQLINKISSPQQHQSPDPTGSRLSIVSQAAGLPATVLRVEKQPIPATALNSPNSILNTPLPTTLALPQVPISSSQLSASIASSSQLSATSNPSPAASPTLSYSRATPSPGRTIFIQQQPGSPQNLPQGAGTVIVQQQQPGTVIPSMKGQGIAGSTLIVQQRPPMPVLPNQPVAANQLPELFQRPRPPPPPPSMSANQNFQNVRILQTSGNANTGVVKTILIPCTNASINNQTKTLNGKQVLQIASNTGGSSSQISNAGAQQPNVGALVTNTGTPLPTSIQLPSEPVPFTGSEMSQLGSNSMPAPSASPAVLTMSNARPPPIASPSRIVVRHENITDRTNVNQATIPSRNAKSQDGAKIMIQVCIVMIDN